MAISNAFARVFAGLSTVFVLGACAHVGQDDFEAEMDRIRQEMREGDTEVENRLGARVDGLEARLDALEADLRDLEDEFDVTVARIGSAIRFDTPIHFGFDQAVVPTDQEPLLARFSSVVAEHYTDALVTVEGFTDPAGSAAYNMRLGQARADAVRGWLVAEGGLSDGRVRAVSYGEDTSRLVIPGAAGPGDRGRENRRVVLVIDYAPEVSDVTTIAGRIGG